MDQREALLNFEIVERRLVRLNCPGEDIGLRLGIIDIDLRRRALADQVAVAFQIALGTGKLRLIACERPLRLFDLCVDLAGVERE